MKKNTYSSLRIAGMLLLMCLVATRSLAQQFVTEPTQYISAICVDSKSLSSDKIHYLRDQGYKLDDPVDVDLNKGVPGSDYVYVGYKTTTNPLEAITDIIVVYCTDGSYSGEKKRTVRYNGRTYYPADYGPDSKGGNLNRGKSGAPDLYFYYTKDRSAAGIVEGDTVVTGLKVDYSGDSKGDQLYAKMWYAENNVQPNADLNKGAGGKYVYLAMNKHVHSQFKQDRENNTWKCGCKHTLEITEAPSKSVDGFYTINNYAQFLWFCDFVNNQNEEAQAATLDERLGACARLNADIDLAAAAAAYARNRFKPLGKTGQQWHGKLDGGGHTISKLTINDDNRQGRMYGLVGYGHGCEIKDLNLADVDIQSNQQYTYLAGFVAFGTGEITISNCSISGKIAGNNLYDRVFAAGIANMPSNDDDGSSCNFHVTGCTNSASVSGTDVSGILGREYAKGGANIEGSRTAIIDRCINEGDVVSRVSAAQATAISNIRNGEITNCLNTGNVKYDTNSTGYFFLPTYGDKTKVVVTNNLSTAPVRDAKGEAEVSGFYINVSADRLASGELCYLLNNSQSAEDQVAWYQTLGTDDFPRPGRGDAIVYHYTNCAKKDAYTNYGMFAEDVDHRIHELPYDLEHNGEFGKDTIWFTYRHCTICDKLITLSNLILKYHKTVLEPSCMADGLEEFCYVEPATSREYFGYRKLEKGNKSQHNPKTAEGYTYCLDCHQLLDFDEDFYRSKKVKNGVLFEISNVYDLLVYNYLHRNPRISELLGYDAKLMNDIDINIPYEWKTMYLDGHTFDGAGHTIRGFYTTGEAAGFFHTISNSSVRDLTLEGTVRATSGALLCAYASDGAVIQNCTTQGLVNNQNGAAGICLNADRTNIVGCRNDAEVRSTAGIAGGIVASTKRGGNVNTISRTANYGPVFGKTDAAGLIATNTGNYLVSNCANYGPIEGYNKVGGLFAEVNPGNSSAGVCDTRFCISVGQTRILAESNYKGAVVGLVNLSGGDKAHQMDVYYNHSQIGIGYVQKGLAPQSNITKTSDETFATGEICIRLNEANDLNSKESENIDGKPIWGQKIGEDTYPSLFNDELILYKVNANDSEFFVYEGQLLPELYLQDKFYFHSPTTFYVQDITYDRHDVKIKKDFYATLYLPFAFQDSDIKVMAFNHYDPESGNVYLDEVDQDNIEADKPYLIRLADDSDLEEKPLVITAQNAQISPSHDMFPHDYDDIEELTTGFYGTYALKSVWGEANFYCISTMYGDFRKAAKDENDGTKVYPFRSVFKLDGGLHAPSLVNILMMDHGGGETGIHDYHFVENGQGTIYNLSGQSVGESRGSLKPGIYVQNGKKIIIK